MVLKCYFYVKMLCPSLNKSCFVFNFFLQIFFFSIQNHTIMNICPLWTLLCAWKTYTCICIHTWMNSVLLCLSVSQSLSLYLSLSVDLLSPSLTECNSSPLFQYHLLYFVRALCHLEINLHRRQTFHDLSVHFTQTFHDLSVHFRQAHCDLSALILMYMMQTHSPLHSDFDVYLVQSSSSSSSIP